MSHERMPLPMPLPAAAAVALALAAAVGLLSGPTAAEPLAPLLAGSSLAPAQAQTGPDEPSGADRMRRALNEKEAAEATNESVEEAVLALWSTQSVPDTDCVSHYPDRYLQALRERPRVARLLDVAQKGAAQEKADLADLLLEQCRYYLKSLPNCVEPVSLGKPCKVAPWGAEAIPYLLTWLDTDPVETAGLFVDMHVAFQRAARARDEARGSGRNLDQWLYSCEVLVWAYSVDREMARLLRMPEARRALSQERLRALEEYAGVSSQWASTTTADYVAEHWQEIFRTAARVLRPGA